MVDSLLTQIFSFGGLVTILIILMEPHYWNIIEKGNKFLECSSRNTGDQCRSGKWDPNQSQDQGGFKPHSSRIGGHTHSYSIVMNGKLQVGPPLWVLVPT